MKPGPESLKRNFEGLCVAHYAGILRYLTALTRDVTIAEDLAQETFLAAYKGLDRFEVGRDFGAYLRGIARNLFLKNLRDNPKEITPVVECIDRLFQTEQRAGVDGLVALERCLKGLDDQEQKIVEQHYTQGQPMEELARGAGQSVSWAKVRLHRIRGKLRSCLERKLAAGMDDAEGVIA